MHNVTIDFLPLFLFHVKLYKQEGQGGFDKTSSKALNVNLLFPFIRFSDSSFSIGEGPL
jgi:hypothetical protein